MIRILILVNCNRWKANPPDMPKVELGEALDIKPLAWGVMAGMSHRGYVVELPVAEFRELCKQPAPETVTMHLLGTKAEPKPLKEFLASVGLELGEE